MDGVVRPGNDKDWLRVDARVLGQLLSAQNVLFVLPDEARIAEFFTQALGEIPGVISCFVCLGTLPARDVDVCTECASLRRGKDQSAAMPHKFSCKLAITQKLLAIPLGTSEHTFGFFILRTEPGNVFEPYLPFLMNLANYIGLSLENRTQRLLLEKERDRLEERVRKRTEELVTLNQELDLRVRARTAQLEAANKELEAFSYSVSHDLRAPLRGMDGFSQALLEDYSEMLDDAGKHYLLRIRAAAQRMAQLIEEMLKLSQVTRSEMRVEIVNLSRLAQEIAGELASREPDRSVVFVIVPDVIVSGDSRLLRVVLDNLLGNAWKFTSKSLEPRIEFGTFLQESQSVCFVRDNGAGFDMKYADRLFGTFQRLHTTEEFPGNGVGLATVQRIIRRHGGRVWAEGLKNQGATIYFVLQ